MIVACLFRCVGVDCAHCPEKSSKFAEDFRDSGLFAVSERLHGIGQTHARACAVDEKAGKVLPRHGCGSKEHAAEAIEAEPSAPAVVKREARRVIRRDHKADECEQAEAVVQNRRVVHPAAEVVKQLTYIVQNRRHVARGGTARFFSSGIRRRSKAPARRKAPEGR